MTDYELAWCLVIGWISLCTVVQLLSESQRGRKIRKNLVTPYREDKNEV